MPDEKGKSTPATQIFGPVNEVISGDSDTLGNIDGDGINNDKDICGTVSNLDQSDADNNAIGDACDKERVAVGFSRL